MRVITFSTKFPIKHPKKGICTFFMEGILNSLGYNIHNVPKESRRVINDFAMMEGSKKHHTIRAGNRWKVGDLFSPRIWSDKPYASKQIEFAPPIEIKKIFEFDITDWEYIINGKTLNGEELSEVAKNDGLNINDFEQWFACHPKKKGETMNCQILCWNENINY